MDHDALNTQPQTSTQLICEGRPSMITVRAKARTLDQLVRKVIIRAEQQAAQGLSLDSTVNVNLIDGDWIAEWTTNIEPGCYLYENHDNAWPIQRIPERG